MADLTLIDTPHTDRDADQRTLDDTGRRRQRRARPGLGTYALRFVVIAYLFFLVAWPVSLVVQRTFADGLGDLRGILGDPDVVHALRLTVIVAVISVLINLLFGVSMSILLVRYEYPGKRLLSALVDLPLAVSPIVVGLALVLTYGGRDGWFGPALESAGFQVIFATPGMVLATTFVVLPLVIREIVPVLEEIGTEQEQAATILGAGPFQTFRRITLPSIKWAVAYGVVLALARSLGEFGAVKVVTAGGVAGSTQTVTSLVEQRYGEFDELSAYSASLVLAATSIVCLVVITLIRPKSDKKK